MYTRSARAFRAPDTKNNPNTLKKHETVPARLRAALPFDRAATRGTQTLPAACPISHMRIQYASAGCRSGGQFTAAGNAPCVFFRELTLSSVSLLPCARRLRGVLNTVRVLTQPQVLSARRGKHRTSLAVQKLHEHTLNPTRNICIPQKAIRECHRPRRCCMPSHPIAPVVGWSRVPPEYRQARERKHEQEQEPSQRHHAA